MNEYIVLIPFYRGDEYRERSIETVIRHCWEHSNHQCRIVVSEQNSVSRTLFHAITTKYQIPIEVVNHTYSGRFNKSRAWNDGILHITKKKGALDTPVLFLDCDILVEPELLKPEVIHSRMCQFKVWHPFTKIADLDKFDSYIVCTEKLGTVSTRIDYHREKARRGYRCYGGALVLTPKTYIEVGGYDNRYDAWGHEDDVFYYACRRLYPVGLCGRENGQTIYHIYHPVQNTFEYVRSDKYKRLATIRTESVRQIKEDVKAYSKSIRFSNGLF